MHKRDKLKIKIDSIPTMYSPVKFLPQNFGGYTLSMLLSGSFIGLAFGSGQALYFLVYLFVSIIIFFVGMYFYAKDNMEEKE